MEEYKMQWLIDRVKNGEVDNVIAKTGKKKGSVVAPTGYGKFGFICEDIIYHIQNMKKDDKYIFNIAAPILLLELQCINDLSVVLGETLKEMVDNKEFMFFVNSSDNHSKYKDVSDKILADTKGFEEIGDFLFDDYKKVAIVASCHKSLDKFEKNIDFIKSHKNITVFNYIDESQLIKVCPYIKNLFYKSDYLYTITATEDDDVRKLMIEITGEKKPIVSIPASQAIKENVIVRPRPFFCVVNSSEHTFKITTEIALEYMDFFKKDNPYINHKLLITCSNSKHLTYLKESLVSSGKKVFSTCVKDGSKSNEDSEYLDIDETEFIKKVDEWDGDCFVLHIKRLTQGVDIKTISDVFIQIGDTHIDASDKRTNIQTIGRGLRTLSGERGKPEDERKKKYGNVVFVIENGVSTDDAKQRLGAMLYDYYGRDNVVIFETTERDVTGGGCGDDFSPYGHPLKCPYFENKIEEVRINVLKYIRENLKRKYEFEKAMWGEELSFGDYLEKIDAFGILKKKFVDCGFEFDESISLNCIITDDEIRSLINKVVEE